MECNIFTVTEKLPELYSYLQLRWTKGFFSEKRVHVFTRSSANFRYVRLKDSFFVNSIQLQKKNNLRATYGGPCLQTQQTIL